jgi:hypothetical protein
VHRTAGALNFTPQEHELRVEADGDTPVYVTLKSGTGEIFGASRRRRTPSNSPT